MTSSASNRSDAIDILRALAMTMVIAQHCGILPFGWTGVWLFYVISGFVIARGLSRFDPLRERRLAAFGHFMQARAARLLPALLVYLAVMGAIGVWLQAPGVLEHYAHLVSFTFNWRMIFLDWSQQTVWSPLGHLWTISVEQQFYLLFPLLAFGVAARHRLAACLALIAVGPMARALTSMAISGWPDIGAKAFAVYASTFGHVDAFLAGAAIAYALSAGISVRRWALPLGGMTLAAAVTYAAWAIASNWLSGATGINLIRNVYSGHLYGAAREVLVYIPVVMASSWLVLMASGIPNGRFHQFGAGLACVGRASFSGYLWHLAVLWALTSTWAGWQTNMASKLLLFVCVWAVTMALAAVSYRWVERPGLRLLKPERGAPGAGHLAEQR